MTDNKTNQHKDKEMFQAYAGVGVMFAFIIILFVFTTPGVLGSDNESNPKNLGTEPTQFVQVIEVATSDRVIETEILTEEPTRGYVIITDTPVPVTELPTQEPTVEANVQEDTANSASATNYDSATIARGETLFITCSACHGPTGTGIEGLGKNLVAGEFAPNATDEELANVIINGRPIWDPANTTMIDMPPRGGNPTLTDEDVNDIIAYIRSLQSP